MRLDQYTRNIGLSPEIGAAPMQGNPSPFEGLSPLAEGLAQKAADIQRRNKILEQQMQIDHATTEQEIWQIDYLDRALKKQEGFSLEGYEEAARKKNEELLSTVTDEYAKKETNLILNKKMAYGNIAVKKAQQAIFEEKVQEEANRRIQSGKDMYVAAVMNPKERIRIYSEVAGGITVSLKAMGRDKDFIDDQLKTIRQNYDLSALQMDIQADPYAAEEAYKRGDYAIDVGDKGAEVERVIKANIEAKETDTYNLLREQIEANPNAPVNTSMLRDEAKVKNLENYRKAERRQQYLQERAMQAQAQADRTEALERQVALAERTGSLAELTKVQGQLDSSFQGIDPTRYSVMTNRLEAKRSQVGFNEFLVLGKNGTDIPAMEEYVSQLPDGEEKLTYQNSLRQFKGIAEAVQEQGKTELAKSAQMDLLNWTQKLTPENLPAFNEMLDTQGTKILSASEIMTWKNIGERAANDRLTRDFLAETDLGQDLNKVQSFMDTRVTDIVKKAELNDLAKSLKAQLEQDAARAQAGKENEYEKGLRRNQFAMEKLRLTVDKTIPEESRTQLMQEVDKGLALLDSSNNPNGVWGNYVSFMNGFPDGKTKMNPEYKLNMGGMLTKEEAKDQFATDMGMLEGEDLFTYMNRTGVGTKENPEAAFVDKLAQSAKRLKMVSPQIQDAIENMSRSGVADPQRALLVLNIYKRLKGDEAIRGFADDDLQGQGKGVDMMNVFADNLDTGAKPEDAWKDAYEKTHPDPTLEKTRLKTFEERLSQYEKELNVQQFKWNLGNGYMDFLEKPSEIINRLPLLGRVQRFASAPFQYGERIPDGMAKDYLYKAKIQYKSHGIEGQAMEEAQAYVERHYGPTRFGKVFMKHSPELYLQKRGMDAGQIHEVMNDFEAQVVQVLRDNRKSWRQYEYTPGLPNLSRNQVYLKPVDGTEPTNPHNNKDMMPDYEIILRKEDGNIDSVAKINGDEFIQRAFESYTARVNFSRQLGRTMVPQNPVLNALMNAPAQEGPIY